MAALIANGASALIQVVARARRWGPQTGTTGALLAGLGYAVTAAAPPTMTLELGLSLLVVLGCASGLLLREGLIDLEAAAPQRIRGALTGAFYTVTYIGFGLPLLLTTVGSSDSAIILAVMAVGASATAVNRAVGCDEIVTARIDSLPVATLTVAVFRWRCRRRFHGRDLAKTADRQDANQEGVDDEVQTVDFVGMME
jgi:hypothetical protein